MERYGRVFDQSDTLRYIKLGTIGVDFLTQRITVIDFENQQLQLYDERPQWMTSSVVFHPFDFSGRRVMLPAIIKGKEHELFYDSGCSAFGLITSKHRYDEYTNEHEPEIQYNASRFGDALEVHHKSTPQTMEIAGTKLGLQSISYVDMYADYQQFLTPFTRISGWLGNHPFIGSTLIIDTREKEFAVLTRGIENE